VLLEGAGATEFLSSMGEVREAVSTDSNASGANAIVVDERTQRTSLDPDEHRGARAASDASDREL